MSNRFIRKNAPGNGSGTDWLNAYTSTPSVMTRGDTYYIGDGSYGSALLDDAVSGSALITIRRATIADHGTDTGWLDSYAAGQATFDKITIATNYWRIESNSKIGWAAGHGILIANAASSSELLRLEGAVTNITIHGVEMHGDLAETHQVHGIYATQIGGCDTVTIEDCNIHHTFGVHCYFINASNLTLQRNNFERNKSTGGTPGIGLEGIHSESLQLRACWNVLICNNRFKDVQGTGAIVSGGVAIPHWPGAETNSFNWTVRNNIFDGGYARPAPVGGETSGAPGAVILDNTGTGGENINPSVNAFYGITIRENIIIGDGYENAGMHAYNGTGTIEIYGNVWFGGAATQYLSFNKVGGTGFTKRQYNHFSKMKGPFALRYDNGGTTMGIRETAFSDGPDGIYSDEVVTPFIDADYTLSEAAKAAVTPYVPGVIDYGGGGAVIDPIDPSGPPDPIIIHKRLSVGGRKVRIAGKTLAIG